MDSSVSPKDEIWFLRVCHHISTGLYYRTLDVKLCVNRLCPFARYEYLFWKGHISHCFNFTLDGGNREFYALAD